MPINHPKGVLSVSKDFFYYSTHWKSWSRILLRAGYPQGFKKEIAIGLTPKNGFNEPGGYFFIRNEYIRIYSRPRFDSDDIYTHVLPKDVYNKIKDSIGIKRTIRLLDFDYLSEIDLGKLIETKKLTMFSKLCLPTKQSDTLMERLSQYPDLYVKPERVI